MQNESEQKGFTIEFEFTPNDHFSNTILTKSYDLRTGPDEQEPLSYEGPEIVKSKGCVIDWKKGKNVTVKMVKKRQKHKNRGTIRVVTKEVQCDSFFNFFSPPTGMMNKEIFLEKSFIFLVPDDADADIEDNDEMRMLAADFEIGHMLRDSIVPKAVLYFTGEAGDEDDGEVRDKNLNKEILFFVI
jgi:nucleosome assembly protein 1-like 1